MKTDNRSYSSFLMLARYYSPGIRRQVLLTAGITLVCYFLTLLVMNTPSKVSIIFISLINSVAYFTYMCGGMLFASTRSRVLAGQLPVTSSSRLTFVLSYVFLFIPAVMAAVWYGANGLLHIFGFYAPDQYTFLIEYLTSQGLATQDVMQLLSISNTGIRWFSILQNMVPAMVCLYVCLAARRNAILFGFISIICTLMAIGTVSGIGAMVQGFIAGLTGMPESDMMESVANVIVNLQVTIGILSTVLLILGGWMIYRLFRK